MLRHCERSEVIHASLLRQLKGAKEFQTRPVILNEVKDPSSRAPLFICCETRLLRWAVLEILMYYVYIPVSPFRPPCTRVSHDNK